MSDVIHKAFALPGLWRLTFLGKLTDNPNSQNQDLRINVWIGEIDNSSDQTFLDGNLVGDSQKKVLPVGVIPLIPANAFFHDGESQRFTVKGELIHQKALLLNFDKSNLTVFDVFAQDASGNTIISDLPAWLNPDNEKNSLFVGIRENDDPYAVIIPAYEIFRFFYASSSVIVEALLRGHFLFPNIYLWNEAKTSKPDEKRAFIWLRQNMLDDDAAYLARFAFDKYAMEQANEIYAYAAAAREQGMERMIRALPPFEGSWMVRYMGIEFTRANKTRMLITRLLHCNYPWPFSDLTYGRDNDARKSEGDESEPKKPIWRRPPPYRTQPDGTIILTDELANSNSSAKHIQVDKERFPFTITKLSKTENKAYSERKSWREIFPELYSTSSGRPSSDFIGQAIIKSLQEAPPTQKRETTDVDVSGGKTNYSHVVKQLQIIRHHKFASVTSIPVLYEFANFLGETFNVFPATIDGRKTSWLYIDKEKKLRRLALLAKIEVKGRTRYLIELQQKTENETSSLILWSPTEQPLEQGVLMSLLLDCAKAKGATLISASMLDIKWSRLKHTTHGTDEKSAQHFLIRIFSAKAINP